jgi:hypothetical protein
MFINIQRNDITNRVESCELVAGEAADELFLTRLFEFMLSDEGGSIVIEENSGYFVWEKI